MRNKCKYAILCEDEKFISLSKEIIFELNPDNEIEIIDNKKVLDFFENIQNSIILLDNTYLTKELIELIKLKKSIRLSNIIYLVDKTQAEHSIHFDEIINLQESRVLLLHKYKFASTLLEYKIKFQSEEAIIKNINSELQNDLEDMFTLTTHFLEARFPGALERTKRIVDASRWIAQYLEMSESELYDLKVASYFCQAGRISLPDTLLNQVVMEDGLPSHPILKQIPHVAKEIVSQVKRFQNSANILFHIYENLDGSGMPEGLQSWQIPLESRIIRVVLDYEEELEKGTYTSQEIIDKIQSMSKRIFDHRVVHLLEQYIRSEHREDYDPSEKQISLADLVPNMLISRDVFSMNGLKLVSKGTHLTQNSIDFIINHAAYDSILGNIYIKR